MAQTKTILTAYGNEQILKAIAEEQPVMVNAMVYGDGGGAAYEPSPAQEHLVNQVGELTSVTRTYDDEDDFIYFSATIPSNAPECIIREIGLIDDNDKLLAVAAIPATSKPAAEDGLEVSLPISIGFRTSTGEVMLVYVDRGDDYPTKAWVNQKLSNIKVICSTNW